VLRRPDILGVNFDKRDDELKYMTVDYVWLLVELVV
jgi:hypothetical protein